MSVFFYAVLTKHSDIFFTYYMDNEENNVFIEDNAFEQYLDIDSTTNNDVGEVISVKDGMLLSLGYLH